MLNYYDAKTIIIPDFLKISTKNIKSVQIS